MGVCNWHHPILSPCIFQSLVCTLRRPRNTLPKNSKTQNNFQNMRNENKWFSLSRKYNYIWKKSQIGLDRLQTNVTFHYFFSWFLKKKNHIFIPWQRVCEYLQIHILYDANLNSAFKTQKTILEYLPKKAKIRILIEHPKKANVI